MNLDHVLERLGSGMFGRLDALAQNSAATLMANG
jgi:hypothetical protein